MHKRFLISVLGPTAVGKTNISVQLATIFSSEIISADSRQFYRELNIGTAKPSSKELCQVKHYFINNLSISDRYSVGDFERESLELLNEYFQTNNIAFLVGGSGLYIKAVTNGFDILPDVDEDIRHELNEEYKNLGIGYLQEELNKCDPTYLEKIDKLNPQRLIRAIEVFRSTGIPFSSFRIMGPKLRSFETIKVGINIERLELYTRINNRVDAMISEGLLEEVKSLVPFKTNNALQTVGYKELFEYLDDKYSFEEAVELIKRNTRRYAKRQLTWFRKDPEIQWFKNDEPELIADYIRQQMKKK